MNEFFTWEMLATFAGAVAATMLVVQFAKSSIDELLIKFGLHLPTRLFAYLVAVPVLLLGLFFTGSLTISTAVLSLFNGFLIAAASSGTYDTVKQFANK